MNQETLEIVEQVIGANTRRIIKVNEQMLNKIRILIASSSHFWASKLDEIKQNSQEPYEIPSETLSEILEMICSSNDTRLKQGYMNFENFSSLSEFMDDYNETFDQYKKLREEDKYSIRDFYTELFFDETRMKTFFDLATQLKQKEKNFYIMRDLSNAKNDITPNLKYFMSDEIIHEFESRYEQVLKMRNIDEMKQILNQFQQLILDHWKSFTSDIEKFKQGDGFKFLCHSTSHVNYEGDFYTKYVSTSLLTENMMDTYKMGYGFVFLPENIVGAKSSDMYVKNGAENDEDLLHYSSIKKIDSPERLIEECMNQKEENRKNGKNEKVYNEVVLDRFNPIAIFCLTDGSMDLNTNYNRANELKKQFPNLKIIEIDTTYYKKDEELFETKKELISRIREAIAKENPNFYNLSARDQDLITLVNDDMVPRYELFWEQFMELKKTGNYNKNDIINLFKHNDKLVSMSFIEPDVIEKCSDKELETILKNNYFFGVKDILNGKVDLNRLDSAYFDLSKFAGNKRLDSIIPGLATFLELYKKMPLTQEIISQMKKCTSFTEINQHIINSINNYQNENQRNVAELSQQIETYQIQIENYQSELYQKQTLIEEYNDSETIVSQEWYYSLGNDSINCEEEVIQLDKNIEKYYRENEELLVESLFKYEQELAKLRKHPILNTVFINKIVKKQTRDQFMLQTFRNRIDEKKESIRLAEQSISEIKKEFQQKTGIDFTKYQQKLEQAKRNIETINPRKLEIEISLIRQELQNIQEKTIDAQQNVTNIDKNTQLLTPDQIIRLMEQGYSIDGNEHDIIQQQKTNEDSYEKTMGFAKICILGVLTTLVSLGIIVLGVLLTYNKLF